MRCRWILARLEFVYLVINQSCHLAFSMRANIPSVAFARLISDASSALTLYDFGLMQFGIDPSFDCSIHLEFNT